LALALAALALCVMSNLVGHIGPMGDLYSPWYGTRIMVLHHSNPYAEEVGQHIQIVYYDHILSPEEHKDEQRFAYPAYTAVLLAPIAFLEYSTVWAAGLPILMLLAAAAVFCSIRFSGWQISRTDQWAAVLLAVSTPPVIRSLRLEQLGILVVFLLAASLLALARGHLVTAGMLLAVATIKPQMAVLPVAWLLAWGLRSFSQRRVFLFSFLGSMAVLIAAPELFVRGWLFSFIHQARAYVGYAQYHSWLSLITGDTMGNLISVAALALTIKAVYKHLDADAASWTFCVCSALVLGVASFIVPTLGTLNSQMMLFPAAFILMRNFASLDKRIRILFIACLAWAPLFGIVTFFIDNGNVRLIQMTPGFLLSCTIVVLLALQFPKFLAAQA
jgi:hypothetical protein